MKVPVRLLTFWLLSGMLSGCSTTPTPTQGVISTPSSEPISTDVPATAEASSVQLVAGQWSYLFYHPGLQQVILVNGGPDHGKSANDPLELWAWDGTRWQLLDADPRGPTWRNFQGVAFDSKRNRLVMHGGVQDQNSRMAETWEWDGQTWTRFDTPGPGYREGTIMAYDEARGVSILFGGANETFELFGDTWAWDGTYWTEVSTTGPAPRFPSAMVYDAAREKVLLYSGHYVDQNDYINFTDLWEWDGTSWKELKPDGDTPGARNIAQMLYHPGLQAVLLLVGGDETFRGDLWSWDGTAWTQLLSSGGPVRSGMSAVYDPLRDRVVAFGGVDRPGGTAITDTWEWDGKNWTCVYGCK